MSDNDDSVIQSEVPFQPHTMFNSRKNQELAENEDYCEKCTPLELRCICNEPDDSNWAPHNLHKFEPLIIDDEKEEVPLQNQTGMLTLNRLQTTVPGPLC